MSTTMWSHDEDMALRKHYQREGPLWVGWEALLPGRTAEAIENHAMWLGLTDERPPLVVPMKSDVGVERAIVRMFHDGKSCSQIDAELRLDEGHAHVVVVAHWLEEKERQLRPR